MRRFVLIALIRQLHSTNLDDFELDTAFRQPLWDVLIWLQHYLEKNPIKCIHRQIIYAEILAQPLSRAPLSDTNRVSFYQLSCLSNGLKSMKITQKLFICAFSITMSVYTRIVPYFHPAHVHRFQFQQNTCHITRKVSPSSELNKNVSSSQPNTKSIAPGPGTGSVFWRFLLARLKSVSHINTQTVTTAST